MRLSEAIRLGIGAVQEERDLFLSEGYHGRPGVCGCAIGTALYAIGYKTVYDKGAVDGSPACQMEWHWTGNAYGRQLAEGPWTIADEISVRHSRGESRESIANWIEQLENERGITDGQTYAKDIEKPIGVEQGAAQSTRTKEAVCMR